MKRIIAYCLMFVVCLGPLFGPSLPVRAQGKTPFIDAAAIDAYVEAGRQAARIPGMAVAVVQGDGSVYLKGYGSAGSEGQPVTPQTTFILGSVSKSFTALAVMQLVEAGKVDLDASIQQYLPWLQFGSFEGTAAGDVSKITVRQLLHQTSGIPTYAGEVAFVGQQSASLEELLRRQSRVTLTAIPGQKFQYSNINYDVLGALVQAVSGEAFGDYLQGHIFMPLEMQHTTTFPGAGLSAGHQYLFGLPVKTNPPFREDNVPAGYIISSAEDMAHYLRMWMGQGVYKNKRLLSSEGISTLQHPRAQVTGYTRYAMGWYSNPDGSVVWHNGSTLNYKATLKILNNDHIGVVVLYNITDDLMSSLFGGGFTLSEGIFSVLYGEGPPAAGILNNGQIYFLLDGVMLLIVAAVLVDILRLRSWRQRALQRARCGRAAPQGMAAGRCGYRFDALPCPPGHSPRRTDTHRLGGGAGQPARPGLFPDRLLRGPAAVGRGKNVLPDANAGRSLIPAFFIHHVLQRLALGVAF